MRSKLHLAVVLGLVVAICVLIFTGIVTGVYRYSLRVRVEEEGVLISSLLMNENVENDFGFAVETISEEYPQRSDFLENWRKATNAEKAAGIEVVRIKNERQGVLVVRYDKSIEWIDAPNHSELLFAEGNE